MASFRFAAVLVSALVVLGGRSEGHRPVLRQGSEGFRSVARPGGGGFRGVARRGNGGSVTDDPHFTSPDGVRFDFHGQINKTFCFITDTRFHVNALLRGYSDPRPFGASAPDAQGMRTRTWMKELGIFWIDARGVPHLLHLVARDAKDAARGSGYLASVTLDGKPVRLPYDQKPVEGDGLHFQFTGVVQNEKPKEEREQFELVVDNEFGGSIVMRPANPQLRTPTDAEVHFNLNLYFLNNTEKVHGVMGQTYRSSKEQSEKSARWLQVVEEQGKPVQADQESGKGFLEGTVQDYISSDVTKPDCKFSQFKYLTKSKP